MVNSDELGSGSNRYSTLAAEHRNELGVKRSRFITVLRRVDTEDDARSLVGDLRKEFHDARHHCSAFVLGADRTVQRSNDDGEPSGTAGAPMLEALVRRGTSEGVTDLSDVCAGVVRYFGGTLLGAEGLVRAYSDSVSSALDGALLVQRRLMQLFTIGLAHEQAGRLENELRADGVQIVSNDYSASGVELTVALPAGEPATGFPGRLAFLTGGRSRSEPSGCRWTDLG